MSRPQWLVLADDLTGALDTGVQLAQRGARVWAFVEGETPHLPPEGTDVAVANLDSRHLPPEQAAERVRAWAEMYAGQGVRRFYKKTDSALRGNIGAELSALRQALGARALWFVPAFPAAGRTTRGGRQFDQGAPLEQSPFARDPHHPMGGSLIPAILGRQCADPVWTVSAGGVPSPSAEGIIVLDAETEEHLAGIARALTERDEWRAVAGCAGFAAHLPLEAHAAAEAMPPIGRPLWIVSGSVNPIALGQIQRAAAAGHQALLLSPQQLLGQEECQTLFAGAQSAYAAGRSVLMVSAKRPEDAEACRDAARQMHILEGDMHRRIQRMLSKALWAAPEGAFRMAIGGDLLSAALRMRGIQGVQPLRELSPGLALSRIGGELWLTKSGGFGGESILADLCEGGVEWSH